MSNPKPIMVKIKDPKGEYFTHMTPDQIARNPENLDLELLGLELVNRLRNARDLVPISYPKPNAAAINYLKNRPIKIKDLATPNYTVNHETMGIRYINQSIVGSTLCGGTNISDMYNSYDKAKGIFTAVKNINGMEITFNANVKTVSPKIAMSYEINGNGIIYDIAILCKMPDRSMIDSISVLKNINHPLLAGDMVVFKFFTEPAHPISICGSDFTVRFF